MDSYIHFTSSRKYDASCWYCTIQALEGITKAAKAWVTKQRHMDVHIFNSVHIFTLLSSLALCSNPLSFTPSFSFPLLCSPQAAVPNNVCCHPTAYRAVSWFPFSPCALISSICIERSLGQGTLMHCVFPIPLGQLWFLYWFIRC